MRQWEQKAADPAFWEDSGRAQEFLKKMGILREKLRPLQELEIKFEDAEAMLDLVREDPAGLGELLAEIQDIFDRINSSLENIELETLLGGEYDQGNAIISLHPGAGGLESQDWAEMLLRMYSRWAERKGFALEIADLLPGDEAGIKSVTMIVRGHGAYGYLQSEKGVHRMIRISPFDASNRRHTSFASVEVIPEIEDDNAVVINPEDLKIDTFRSGGAGGQHVNKTDSAVRITHLPTKIVVTCQNNRSQHSNRQQAMHILLARLVEKQRRAQAQELSAMRGLQKEIAWGSQIRTYTFQPFTLVKDHRTGMEAGQVEAVMNGEIDPFIEAFLRWQARTRVHGSASSPREKVKDHFEN